MSLTNDQIKMKIAKLTKDLMEDNPKILPKEVLRAKKEQLSLLKKIISTKKGGKSKKDKKKDKSSKSKHKTGVPNSNESIYEQKGTDKKIARIKMTQDEWERRQAGRQAFNPRHQTMMGGMNPLQQQQQNALSGQVMKNGSSYDVADNVVKGLTEKIKGTTENLQKNLNDLRLLGPDDAKLQQQQEEQFEIISRVIATHDNVKDIKRMIQQFDKPNIVVEEDDNQDQEDMKHPLSPLRLSPIPKSTSKKATRSSSSSHPFENESEQFFTPEQQELYLSDEELSRIATRPLDESRLQSADAYFASQESRDFLSDRKKRVALEELAEVDQEENAPPPPLDTVEEEDQDEYDFNLGDALRISQPDPNLEEAGTIFPNENDDGRKVYGNQEFPYLVHDDKIVNLREGGKTHKILYDKRDKTSYLLEATPLDTAKKNKIEGDLNFRFADQTSLLDNNPLFDRPRYDQAILDGRKMKEEAEKKAEEDRKKADLDRRAEIIAKQQREKDKKKESEQKQNINVDKGKEKIEYEHTPEIFKSLSKGIEKQSDDYYKSLFKKMFRVDDSDIKNHIFKWLESRGLDDHGTLAKKMFKIIKYEHDKLPFRIGKKWYVNNDDGTQRDVTMLSEDPNGSLLDLNYL
jgi:hypothetical protein